jgi:hypothetical protein
LSGAETVGRARFAAAIQAARPALVEAAQAASVEACAGAASAGSSRAASANEADNLIIEGPFQ